MWREMRRKNQQLSFEECEAILKEGQRGTLAVLGDDGYPYAVPLNYLYLDGIIYFHGAREGHKLDALRAYDKCSFCVLSGPEAEEGRWWYCWRSVIAFGRMSVVTDEERKWEMLLALGRKYMPTETEVQAEFAQGAARVEMLEMHLEHITGKHVREK